MDPETKEELLKFINVELLTHKKAVIPLEVILNIFNPNPSGSTNNSAGMMAGLKAKEWLDRKALVYEIGEKEIEIFPNP